MLKYKCVLALSYHDQYAQLMNIRLLYLSRNSHWKNNLYKNDDFQLLLTLNFHLPTR